jgi:hypothetical protein
MNAPETPPQTCWADLDRGKSLKCNQPAIPGSLGLCAKHRDELIEAEK